MAGEGRSGTSVGINGAGRCDQVSLAIDDDGFDTVLVISETGQQKRLFRQGLA